MQLAGSHVFGPPADYDAAVAVLREAIDLGITHIDTSDYYGPHVRTRSSRRRSIRIRPISTNRSDDDLIDLLAAQGIAYVPYFPLGGFTPLQSDTLKSVANRLDATPMGVALAWLLQRSPNILLIPGTSSVAHLRENVAGAALSLPDDALAELNDIAPSSH